MAAERRDRARPGLAGGRRAHVVQDQALVFGCGEEELWGSRIESGRRRCLQGRGRTLESADHARERTAIAWELNVVWRELDPMSNRYIWPFSVDIATRDPSGLCAALSTTRTRNGTEAKWGAGMGVDTDSSLRMTHMFAKHPKLAAATGKGRAALSKSGGLSGVDGDISGAACGCVGSAFGVQRHRPRCMQGFRYGQIPTISVGRDWHRGLSI